MSPEPLLVRPLNVGALGVSELIAEELDGVSYLLDYLSFPVLDSDNDQILTTSP